MTISDDPGCDKWIEAISALADGEDPAVDQRLLDAHLDRCAPCRAFSRRVDQTQAPLRVRPAPTMPDLSRRIVKLNAVADRARWRVFRLLLAVAAVEIIATAVPALLYGEEHGLPSHPTRHLGAFSLAYGVALLVVVVRPARARSVLPIALTLSVALLLTAIVDVANGNAPLLGEFRHVPELLSVPLIWLMAAPSLLRTPPERRNATPQLRIVEADPPQRRTRDGT